MRPSPTAGKTLPRSPCDRGDRSTAGIHPSAIMPGNLSRTSSSFVKMMAPGNQSQSRNSSLKIAQTNRPRGDNR